MNSVFAKLLGVASNAAREALDVTRDDVVEVVARRIYDAHVAARLEAALVWANLPEAERTAWRLRAREAIGATADTARAATRLVSVLRSKR